ncbi:MAG TPA: Gfo/Idh/MocA family oxidoreductase, partial [Chthoniobacteraceae bacterium]|nr:Gfo/Idh/MocA family oxidoreductase [Chthoniobacteraceae bacterium]
SQNGFLPSAFPAITTMVHPLEEIGARLLEMLFARIASGGQDQPGRYEAVAFSIGSTTRSAENDLLLRHSRTAFASAEPLSSPPKQSKLQTQQSMSEPTHTPIPVAIVGLGRAGWHLHLQPFLKLPGFKIVGVADPVAERCKEAADLTGCEQYNNIDELLKATSATAVVIATPSAMHYNDALKVLNSGRHCILEKPIAMTACEANELVELAKKLNLKLFVNHSHLHRGELPHLQEVIKSGILGPLFHIRAVWGNYARRWDWQTLRKNGGGALNNTCPHMLSIVLPLLGSPVSDLYSDLRNIKDAGDAEDHVHLVLRTQDGPTADIVVSSAIALGLPKWTICGKYGTLQSDGTTSKLRYYNPAKATPLSVLDTAAPDRKYLREELPWEEKEIKIPETTTKPFHENIYDVLVHGAPQVVTPESAAEVVRVTELAHQNARN